MHILFSILFFVLVSFAAFSEQGTMSTDDTREARAEASLSGRSDTDIEAQEEEVQIENDDYDPDATEIDEEKMEEYKNQQQDVQY